MSTTVTTVNDKELIGYLDNLGLTSKLTPQEKDTYLSIAKAFGLNPFKREIHVSKYGDNLSIITGYEVYIKRAERSGQLDGWNAITSGSVASRDLKATVTIYRKDRSHPFIWEALYEECVQKTRDGKVTKFWEKSSFMTKKVAISQAFRLCFSDELGGMPYTADEMPEQIQDITHEDITNDNTEEVRSSLLSATNEEELKTAYKSLSKEDQKTWAEFVKKLKANFVQPETNEDENSK